MKQIPNLFTLLNLFLGATAIILILQTGQTIAFINNEGYTMVDLPEKITWGALLIFCAAIVDFLDGFVARLFKATSEIGKQLDSLADVVSFGVAPAIIVYQFLRLCYAQQENGLQTEMLLLIPAFILPCAGAYRLARFNIDTEQSYSFKGLPIPAAGLLIASMPLIYWFADEQWVLNLLLNKWFWYALIIVLSWLMVSKLPLMGFKFKDFGLKNNLTKWLVIGVAIVSGVLLKWMAIPVTIAAYIIVSLLFKNRNS
jgi:CDP-diacylglycerol--serine O-phosphatidyltransferase